MTYDRERCLALADELIEAARDRHRAPGTIFYSDAVEVFESIAAQLHRKKVPAATVATIMRGCAASFGVLVQYPWDRDHQVTVEPGPTNGDGVREALLGQLRRMEQLVEQRPGHLRLSQACETVRAELVALDQGGAIDRAEAMVRLAGMICDYMPVDEVFF
jgi:hypothetical protein